MFINHLFLLSPSARPQFLFFLPPFARPFMALAFERMFTSRCLCAIIRQCRITLSLYRYRCPPLRFFVLLHCNYSLSAEHSVHLHVIGHHSYTSRLFLIAAREQQLPCSYAPDMFTFSFIIVINVLLVCYKYIVIRCSMLTCKYILNQFIDRPAVNIFTCTCI